MEQPNTPPSTLPVSRPVLDPVATLLSQTWQMFNAHFPKLLGISSVFFVIQFALAVVLVMAGVFALIQTTDAGQAPSIPGALLGGVIMAVVFGFISIWNVVALYTYIIRHDRTYSVQQTITDARSKIIPYFSTGFLVGLIVFGGVLLLIIPGIYWGVVFGFAPLVTLVEGLSAPAALSRSKFLVSGYWWAIFGRQFLIGLVVYAISLVINYIIASFIGVLSSMYAPLVEIKDVGGFFSNLLFAPFNLIFSYLLYQNLRRIKG